MLQIISVNDPAADSGTDRPHPAGRTSPEFTVTGSPPLSIPDHELVHLIGRGSYGQVWLARSHLGTWRAVKIVSRDAFEDRKPLEREFKGIQRFEPISRAHDGLVDILQVGGTGDYFYYVMELFITSMNSRVANLITKKMSYRTNPQRVHTSTLKKSAAARTSQ